MRRTTRSAWRDRSGLPAASTTPGSLGRLAHYEIQEIIGQGGCGIVLKAFDEKLQRVSPSR